MSPRRLSKLLAHTGLSAFIAFASLALPDWFSISPAAAQSAATTEPPEMVEPLSDSQVERFVDSLSALEAWAEPGTLEMLALGLAVQPGSLASPLTNAFRMIQNQPDGHEIGRIAQDHGFRDGEEWAATGDRVTRAAVALALERRDTTIDRELTWAQEQLDRDQSLPAQQKMMLQGMLRAQADPLRTALGQVPPEDTRVVEPHFDRLESLVESRARRN